MLTTMLLILVPAAAGLLVARRAKTIPLVRCLGVTFDMWADSARNGPKLTGR